MDYEGLFTTFDIKKTVALKFDENDICATIIDANSNLQRQILT